MDRAGWKSKFGFPFSPFFSFDYLIAEMPCVAFGIKKNMNFYKNNFDEKKIDFRRPLLPSGYEWVLLKNFSQF